MDRRLLVLSILFFITGILVAPYMQSIITYVSDLLTKKEAYNIYVVYSPTCPHCTNLLEYLDKTGKLVIKVTPEEFVRMEVYKELSRYFYGVPFVFAKVNDSFIIISGYPSKQQEIDGYFYGLETEMKLCNEMNGTAFYINNNYAFCNLSGIILGNKYAIDWLIETCKIYGCEKVE
jgi:Glutaredoxin.